MMVITADSCFINKIDDLDFYRICEEYGYQADPDKYEM